MLLSLLLLLVHFVHAQNIREIKCDKQQQHPQPQLMPIIFCALVRDSIADSDAEAAVAACNAEKGLLNAGALSTESSSLEIIHIFISNHRHSLQNANNVHGRR